LMVVRAAFSKISNIAPALVFFAKTILVQINFLRRVYL